MKRTQTKITVISLIAVLGLAAAVVTIKGWTSSSATTSDTTDGVLSIGSATAARLLQPAEHMKEPMPYRSEEERLEWVSRNKRFAALWLTRDQKDVTEDIASFLEDPDPHLRERAAKALGRLDSDAASQALTQKWQKQQDDRAQRKMEKAQRRANARQSSGALSEEDLVPDKDVPELTFRLAMGRAKGRKLQGKAKLEAMAQNVGLNFEEVRGLARKVKTDITSRNPQVRQAARYSPTFDLIMSFVAVLRDMGKKGERIQDLGADDFAIGPELVARIRGASMAPREEAKEILDRAVQTERSIFDESYFIGLGPEAAELLIERLQEIEKSPQKDRVDWGYISLFRAAAMTEDSRVVPLLEKFKQSQNPSVRSYAITTLDDIRRDKIFPKLPA